MGLCMAHLLTADTIQQSVDDGEGLWIGSSLEGECQGLYKGS